MIPVSAKIYALLGPSMSEPHHHHHDGEQHQSGGHHHHHEGELHGGGVLSAIGGAVSNAKEMVKEVAGGATADSSNSQRSGGGGVLAALGGAMSDAKFKVKEVMGGGQGSSQSTNKGFSSYASPGGSNNTGSVRGRIRPVSEEGGEGENSEDKGKEESGGGDRGSSKRGSSSKKGKGGLGAMVPGGLKDFFQRNAGGGEEGGEDGKEPTSALVKPVESFFDQLAEVVPGGGMTIFIAVASMMAGLNYYLWVTYQEPNQPRPSKAPRAKVDAAARFDADLPPPVKKEPSALVLGAQAGGGSVLGHARGESDDKKKTVITKHEEIRVIRSKDKD